MKSAILYLLLVAFTFSPQPLTQNTENQKGVLSELSIASAEASELQCSYAQQELNATMAVWVTAYSSTPEETDDTPFVTASGKQVRDGIVATNLFPFGTLVTIPELFGDRIFTVEDRMHRRKQNFLDVWMPTKDSALSFGIQCASISVLNHNTLNAMDTSLHAPSPFVSYAMSSAPYVLSVPADAL